MSVLLDKWLAVYDPIHRGYTPRGIAMGLTATRGLSFPARSGLHILYRGSPSSVNWSMAVGAVSPTNTNPTRIANFPTYPFLANTIYWFGLRAVGMGGVEETGTDNVLRIETDGSGVPLSPIPNAPIFVSAVQVVGGKILLVWDYNENNQQTPPVSWNIYHDNGTGTVDYVTPLGNSLTRRFLSGAYATGTVVEFTVRSVGSFGVEEKNTNTVSQTADATGPESAGYPVITLGTEI